MSADTEIYDQIVVTPRPRPTIPTPTYTSASDIKPTIMSTSLQTHPPPSETGNSGSGPDQAGPSTRRRQVSRNMAGGAQSSASGSGSRSGAGVEEKFPASVSAAGAEAGQDKPQYIQPDHFYPLTNHMSTPANLRGIPQLGQGVWLTPEEDPQALRGIPVFKPTMEEFQDFEGYAKATTAWGQYSGITKIIPPAEWTSSNPPIPKSSLASVRIRQPIQQNILGSSGLFRIANVVKNKSRPLTVEEWFKKCNDKKFAGLGPKDIGKTLNRDSKEAIERRERVKAEMKQRKDEKREKKKKADERRASRAAQAAKGEDEQPIEAEPEEDAKQEQTVDGVPPLDPSGDSPHSSPDPHPTTPDSDAVEPWYTNFNPMEDWLPRDSRPEDYTVEACAALERHFWKNMGLGEPSWYGADMEGSLFVDEKTPWNVAHLPNLLNRWDLSNLPGVNSPYLYFGMWGASFAWHVEDMDLFSINYIHFGAPKFWYAIPQLQAEKFERILQGYFTEDARHCDQFLRHKSFAVSPHRLANDGINVNMLVHNQGEFVITYPRGYHAGFNMGFNCAESVNFALDSWVKLGRRAKACSCVSHSVRIDVDEMLAQEERRIRGEQDLLDAIEEERKVKKPRKRQNLESAETPRKKTRREPEIVNNEDDDLDVSLSVDAIDNEQVTTPVKMPIMRKKKPAQVIDLSPTRASAKPAIVKQNPVYPCLFCPGLSTEELLPVFNPSERVKDIWKPRTTEIKVHHSCALAMPAVGIEDKEVDGQLKTYVMGVENIEPARWKLRCAACSDKRLQKTGAKIQCTKGKCPRSYHVSCARDSDVASLKVWEVEVPLLPGEGEEPLPEGAETPMVKDIKVEMLCPQHNPEKKAQLEQRKAEEFKQKILSIPVGSRVKIRVKGGASIEYTLVEVQEDSQEVSVQDDAGAAALYPWTSIDFRPAPLRMLENEYARVHTHVRRSSENRSAEATPTTIIHPRPQTVEPQPQKRPAASTQTIQALIHPPPLTQQGPRKLHPPPTVHPAPLRVEQMLNPRPDAIPSRVVLCEAPSIASRPHPAHRHSAQRLPSVLDPTTVSTSVSYTDSHSITLPPPHYAPPPVSYSASGLRVYDAPYKSRDPYTRPLVHERPHLPLPPPHRANQPAHLGLSAQPPPFQVINGYHPSASAGYLPLVHSMPVRGYSASSDHSLGAYPTPPTSGHASQISSGGQPRRRSSNEGKTNGTGVGKIDLGIQRMQALMNALPPMTVPAIHLAGTNGKGSVSAIAESCLMAAGINTARYNSPHLIEPRDAIRINGQPPSRQAYLDTMNVVEQINVHHQLGATTFEIATAAAYHLINTVQPRMDVMIIECGMGGARDATNVIPDQIKLASALTAVGLDHTSFLGNSISEIAEEKAKIAVPGGLLVVGPQQHYDALHAANRVAVEKGSRVVQALQSESFPIQGQYMSLRPFHRPPGRLVRTPLPVIFDSSLNPKGGQTVIETELNLGGAHQLDNLSLALTLLHAIRLDPRARSIQPKLGNLSDGKIQLGVKRAEWAGRCSWLEWRDARTGISAPLLVDGAHNSDSAITLRDYIDSLPLFPKPKVRFIISLSASPGKTIESVLHPLIRPGDEVHLIEFTTPVEGMPWIKPVPLVEAEAVVAGLVGKENVSTGGKGVRGIEEVLRGAAVAREERLTVICGSLYLVADAYRLFMR